MSIIDILSTLISFAEKFHVFPSLATFRSFIFYMAGILLKPRFTDMLSISKQIRYPYQRIQYLISESKWKAVELGEKRVLFINKLNPGSVILIIDDTSWRRWNRYTSRQYCGNLGKVEQCQVVVRADIVLLIEEKPIRIPIVIKPYFQRDKVEEFKGEIGEFKSKIELAKECIEEAVKYFDIEYVIFDSWYTEETLIKFLEERRLKWLGQLKCNRIVRIGRRKMSISGFVTAWEKKREKEGKRISSSGYLCCFYLQLQDIGKVKVVVVKEFGERRYIVTRGRMASFEMIRLKKMKWQTERMNDELKNMLGMDEYRVRNIEGAKRHCEIVSTVYFFYSI
jgi:SRSO17 transposase